ncbi:DNA gyrase subunit A [Microgenomates group bacterium]|nr:DNA gyrase subunit A [Microgenomates group bacterium]
MTYIKGPDFPTGGIIYDAKAISEAYATGRGRIITRAKAEIVESKKGGFQIVATEIPYQVNKTKLIEKIAQLVKDKRIVGIRDINDYSDRKGLNVTIDLKKDAKPKVILNKLFQLSEFQTSFSLNMVALNSQGVPQLMNLKQVLREYVTHRELVIIKRSQFELVKARNRAHILEGLLIALDNIDAVIKTIRESYDDAKEKLMEKFKLSEVQALAILEMQLKRLQGLERDKLEEEYKQIQQTIIQLLTLLNDPKKILAKLSEETQELIDAYGDERRTKVMKAKVGEFSEEDLISNETAIVTLTQTGYIKRLSPDSFRAQSRGGKGATGVKMKEEDVVKNLLTVKTHDYIMLFTTLGRVFKLRAFEIPEASRQAKGTAVVNLISLKADEKVDNILIVDPSKDADKYVALVTRMGLVKKTAVKLFDNIRQNGIIAIDLNKDDNLVWGKITTGEDDIMLITRKGKSIRFSEKEVKSSARDTKGVKGIALEREDYVVGVESINQEEKNNDNAQHLLVVTENGLGKRTKLSEYPLQKRSGMGVKVSEVTAKTGRVAMAGKTNKQSEELIISTQLGQTIKLSLEDKSVPVLSRATQGVILIRPEKGDSVVTATVTIKQELA